MSDKETLECDQWGFWQKKKNKSGLIEYLKIDRIKEYDSQKISNRFADYFTGVGKKFASKISQSKKSVSDYLKLLQSNQNSLFLLPTCVQEIKTIVSKLPSKASQWAWQHKQYIVKRDNWSTVWGACRGLQQVNDSRWIPYHNETSWGSSSVQGQRTLPRDQLLAHIITNHHLKDPRKDYLSSRLLFPLEHWSNLWKSVWVLKQVAGTIIKSLENQQYSACILLDLSKAFDTIEHSILLQKLEAYGIRGNALSWFESYLTNRKLWVKCQTARNTKETLSEEKPVLCGTPQGSCLGPLIFLIFVNDLHLHLTDVECIQFANDTTLVFTHRNLQYLRFCIESELSIVQDWFNANKLTLNVEKSSYLLYHNQNNPYTHSA